MSDAPEPTLPLRGGCGCGAVTFEITEPLVAAAYCHCSRCRHRTGTGMQASAATVPGSFRLLAGGEHVGRWSPGGKDKCFCRECGSALFAQSPDDPENVFVRLGAIEGDPGVRPMARQFVADAAPWEAIPDDGLPRFDEAVAL